ncbi:endonuclease/exonuclease/phosphatase family protein [Rheinheimera sp. WS51]|uniref:endonuclease/exonuclease/phosphatase family protein n=1 Tax=Rheinheimera sp. WS51 TaxID=3425886 RepID=UPI003D89F593
MPSFATDVTFATFNVSMEAQNYLPRGETGDSTVLAGLLKDNKHSQIKNIAHIIQLVRPDVLVLNEFDYIAEPNQGIQAFIRHYLNQPQGAAKAIDYPYFYYNTVNTGQPSSFDLNNDGKATDIGADAWGFGFYPGQYGMVLLSKYPIDKANIRTFQHFKWRDMPNFIATKKADGSPWYSKAAWQKFPLSSKSHWDIPLTIAGETVRVLMSHPTPPAFDGPEKRNANRNHDEIRFWLDYISENKADYIYDDNGKKGGLEEAVRFVIMGDQNASADKEGNALHCAICNLVNHDKVNNSLPPRSKGGAEHTPDNPVAAFHTAAWRMRADYVIPSKFGFKVKQSGVFWPAKDEANYHLVSSRNASSDHRMVWLKLALTATNSF